MQPAARTAVNNPSSMKDYYVIRFADDGKNIRYQDSRFIPGNFAYIGNYFGPCFYVQGRKGFIKEKYLGVFAKKRAQALCAAAARRKGNCRLHPRENCIPEADF